MCSRWREAGAKWIDVVFLVLIGVLSPWLLMFATAFTMILGSLAYVAAPVVSGFGSYLIASFCLERTSRRLFWIYPCMALMSFAFPFMGELFPKQGPGGGGEPSLGGAMAATSGALAMFLVVPFVLFPWAVGLAVAALRHSKPPN